MKLFRYVFSLVVLLVPVSLWAETGLSIQVFGGTADTGETDITVDVVNPPVTESVKVNGSSNTFGIRFLATGVLDPSLNMGIELSNFEATSDTANIDVWPLSYQIMYSFKGHAVEPYAGIGIMLAYFYMDVPEDFGAWYDVGGTGFSDGYEFLVGLSYPFKAKYSLFVEYRLRYMSLESETTSIIPDAVTTRTHTDLDTNLFLIGISFDH